MAGTMEGYIHETPSICERIFQERKTILKEASAYFKRNEPKRILLIASGSSYNAAVSARFFMEKILGIEVSVRNPHLYLKYEREPEKTDLVIGISQSGRSVRIIEGLQKTIALGIKTFALTNNPEEQIGKSGSEMIPLSCGEESIGYVTKGYTATLLLLFLFALESGVSSQRITSEEYDRFCGMLLEIVKKMPENIKHTTRWIEKLKPKLKSMERVIVIGGGPHFGTALEGALKIGETLRIPSSGYELEEFMHGPYLELSEKQTIFCISSGGKSKKTMELLYEYTERHSAKTFFINSDEGKNDRTLSFSIQGEELLMPLLMILPMQVITAKICSWNKINLNVDPHPDFGVFMNSKVKKRV